MPSNISSINMRGTLKGLSPRASILTIMVSVCVPAMPACPITTGRNTANTASESRVGSNQLSANPAIRTVARFSMSHGSLLRTDSVNFRCEVIEPVTPMIRNMSSVASCSATFTKSLTPITPSNLFDVLVTGTATSSYRSMTRTASSWSSVAETDMTSRFMISDIVVPGLAKTIVASSSRPTSWSCASATYNCLRSSGRRSRSFKTVSTYLAVQ